MLNKFKNEDAIELLADIIEPATEIMADVELTSMLGKVTKLEFIKKLLKTHSKSIIEIMAVIEGVPVAEYECNVLTLPRLLLELLNDKELMSFFTARLQGIGVTASGDATETSTETETA